MWPPIGPGTDMAPKESPVGARSARPPSTAVGRGLPDAPLCIPFPHTESRPSLLARPGFFCPIPLLTFFVDGGGYNGRCDGEGGAA